MMEGLPGNEWRRRVAEHIREAYIASLSPDVIFVTSVFEGFVDDAITSISEFTSGYKTITTSYDLIPLVYQNNYLTNKKYKEFYSRKLEYLNKSEMQFSISDHTSKEINKVINIPFEKISKISPACDAIFRPIEISNKNKEQLFERLGIKKHFILYTGGADWRKNLHRLIRAFAQLPSRLRESHQLVIAGKVLEDSMEKLRETAHSVHVNDEQLLFTSYISDHELVQLYNLCAVYVFPSVHEGFGLPLLEAMSCGAPVIGANTTSVPEVIGYENALFDPFDEMAMSQKIAQVLEDTRFRAELISNGFKQAAKFTWDRSAIDALAAFDKLHSGGFTAEKPDPQSNLLPRLIGKIASLVPSDISETEIVKLSEYLSKIPPHGKMKQLFVDISELSQRDAKTGVQRVTRSILKELMDHPPENYIVRPVYGTIESKGYLYANKYINTLFGTKYEDADERIEYFPGDIFLGLDLQHHTTRVQSNYLSLLRSEGVSIYFVVYDLLPIHFPECWPPQHSVQQVHHEWLTVIHQFDGVICISRAVADEVRAWQAMYKVHHERSFPVEWFHLGADVDNSLPTQGLNADSEKVLQHLKDRTTFLMVGTLEPRKCHLQVIQAMELLWKSGASVNLVIIGKKGWMAEEVESHLLRHPERDVRLFWLEGISDEYLERIYAVSTCLIAASKGEGFGLPLIEAARHHMQIIARDIPVFREVAGGHAYYYAGESPEALAESLTTWLGLYESGTAPASEGIPWQTWEQSARQLWEVIRRMHNRLKQ